MKAYFCDKCGKQLEDGPVGATYTVKIEFEPWYGMSQDAIKWELCSEHAEQLKIYLGAFRRKYYASQD